MAVDDLFDGDASGAQLPNPIPRLRAMLAVAGVLVALGPFCCTGAFGAFLSLWIWTRAGDAISRVEAGLHPGTLAPSARTVRRLAFGLMSTSALSLFVQSILWGQGFYQAITLGILNLFGISVQLGPQP